MYFAFVLNECLKVPVVIPEMVVFLFVVVELGVVVVVTARIVVC